MDKYEPRIITDGAINYERYLNSKYKIAWFLKEAYTEEDTGFELKDYLGHKDSYNIFFRNVATQTWHPIIYATFGILNNFIKYNDIPFISNSPTICDIINEVVVINANKEASETGTYTLEKNLNKAFNKYKEVISEQIKFLNPDIYIFCGTFHLYQKMFSLTEEFRIHEPFESSCNIWKIKDKLYVKVYHPANRIVKREVYVNQLIEAVEKYY